METLEAILADHPFFKGLDPRYLELIVGCASNVRFEANQFVFREDEEANTFYLLRQGKVAQEVFSPEHGPITVRTVREGEVLGFSWLLPPYRWHFDARALEVTRAIALDAKCLRTKCEENHDLGFTLMKRCAHEVAEWIDALTLQLVEVYSDRPLKSRNR